MTQHSDQIEKASGFQGPCPCCPTGTVVPRVEARNVDVRHNGTLSTVFVDKYPISLCDTCGAEFVNAHSDAAALEALGTSLGIPSGTTLRQWREAANLTQREVAQDTGIAAETLSRYENDRQLATEAYAKILLVYYSDPERYRQAASLDRPRELSQFSGYLNVPGLTEMGLPQAKIAWIEIQKLLTVDLPAVRILEQPAICSEAANSNYALAA